MKSEQGQQWSNLIFSRKGPQQANQSKLDHGATCPRGDLSRHTVNLVLLIKMWTFSFKGSERGWFFHHRVGIESALFPHWASVYCHLNHLFRTSTTSPDGSKKEITIKQSIFWNIVLTWSFCHAEDIVAAEETHFLHPFSCLPQYLPFPIFISGPAW